MDRIFLVSIPVLAILAIFGFGQAIIEWPPQTYVSPRLAQKPCYCEQEKVEWYDAIFWFPPEKKDK